MNNFHTHTKRCNHATGKEEDYVKSAIKAGYKRLGFTSHMPLPPKDNESSYRMSPYEADEYVKEVLRLKEIYKDQIDILLSFEFEYFYDRVEWADYLIDKYPLDYTIVGNHYFKSVNSGNHFAKFDKKLVLEKYYDTSKFIIESDKFNIYAHPDLFMDSYIDWDEKSEKMTKKICRLANKHGVILEYNLAGVKNEREYPNKYFWKVAIQEQCQIIIGIDAHSPDDFALNHHKEAIKMLTAEGANLVLDLNI